MGQGLKKTGGKLKTLEIDPERVKKARLNIKKAGLEDIITVIEGDAGKTISGLTSPFDFIFIDANFSGYITYFNMLMPKLKRGGVIVAHNAVSHASSIREYLDTVNKHPELLTIILSTTGGDGMAVSFKR
jgi:predicted O-methyltransferase YrrM